ncbi:MAG: hypothetical protein IPJ49_16370 [Candidatus Obscuribacter sp.]|nr:hypothetical protein [Candidatus Obscuribacter sp.]
MDEVLLDLERAMRATGRGSIAIATEWMREAQADMMELAQALGLGSGAGSDGGDCSEGGGCSEGGSSSEVSSEAPVEQVAADDNSHGGGHDSGAQSPSVETPSAAEGDGHTIESDSVNDAVEPGTATLIAANPLLLLSISYCLKTIAIKIQLNQAKTPVRFIGLVADLVRV